MDGLVIRRAGRSRLAELDLDRLVFGEVFSDHMFSTIYRDGAWRGPEIVPYGPIEIEPGAMTLHYAQMAFEGLKAFLGVDGRVRLFRPDRNARRLRLSCRRMCIPEIEERDFIEAVTRLVDIDRGWISDRPGFGLYVRPVVFSAEPHLEVRPSNSYRFIVMTCPVGAYFRTGDTGLSLKVEDQFARTAPHGGVGETKTSANYATTFLAGRQARDEGFDQVLWLDGGEHRYVEEAGLMNVFFRIGDRVVTPALNGAILPGVTRESIVTLLEDRGIAVEERSVGIDEIVAAFDGGALEEVFVTGTAAAVLPVGRLNFGGRDLIPKLAETAPLTGSLYEELTGIQYGRLDDRHGWTRPVEMSS